MKKYIYENLLIWENMAYPETITVYKTSGPRHVLYYLTWSSDKKFGDLGLDHSA